jgi:hypothetical protein
LTSNQTATDYADRNKPGLPSNPRNQRFQKRNQRKGAEGQIWDKIKNWKSRKQKFETPKLKGELRLHFHYHQIHGAGANPVKDGFLSAGVSADFAD